MMIENKFLGKEIIKETLFEKLEEILVSEGFKIDQQDMQRPWGGFFVIDENQITAFKTKFFPELNLDQVQLKQKLSPKILLVAPGKRLSWQYHHRRAEVWKLVNGHAAIVRSNTDVQNEPIDMLKGELVRLNQGERHRLVGKDSWGVVAEIWMHTDKHNPSDEEDIVRVEDDFARK
ncbi:phosphoheptose isomerase [Aquiflexum lacus]|uniref:phosphoheptose isomerase n=1 Tax=Aquiflexum lacus TaxID=2483805 RepID=UPI00293BD591|nr:phosphoheptose isomerase [Aquiflexum lacus]